MSGWGAVLQELTKELLIVGVALAGGAAGALLVRYVKRPGAPDYSRVRVPVVLGLGMVAFAATFAYLANRKFDAFMMAAVDLGIQHQVYWAAGRGGFLYQTVILGRPHLNHVALLTQLISSLSAVAPSVRTLLILQPAVLASAAVPAFLLARRVTPSRWLACAFGLSLLFLVPFQSLSLYDYHERIFAPALVLWALWFAERGRTRPALLFFFLTVLVLEELAIYVTAAGLALALARRWRWGWPLAAAALAYFLAAIYIVYPQLLQLGGMASNPILNTFGVAGSPLDFARYVAAHPDVLLARLREPARWAYLVHMARPWLFLSLGAGWGWLTYATPLVYALFSQVPNHFNINFQYALPFVPFLFYFAVTAWGRLERAWARRPVWASWARRTMTGYLVIAGVAGSYAFGPLGKAYNAGWYTAPRHAERFPRLAGFISRDRSLAASMFLLPRFSERWRISLFPHQFIRHARLFPYEVAVRTAAMYDFDAEPWVRPGFLPSAAFGTQVGGPVPIQYDAEKDWRLSTVVRLLRDHRYACVYADRRYVLLRRGATPIISSDAVFDNLYRRIEDDDIWSGVGVHIFDERTKNFRAIYCPAVQGGCGVTARTPSYHWPPGVVKVNYRMALNPSLTTTRGKVGSLVVVRFDPARPDPPAAVAVRLLTSADFPTGGGYTWQSLAFEADAQSQYQFLVYSEGVFDLYLDEVTVEAPLLKLDRAFVIPKTDAQRREAAAAAAALRPYLARVPSDFQLR